MKQLIEHFKVLSDENRFRILMMLRIKPMCVCEILAVLDIANSTLSSHLKILKNNGFIRQHKDGRWIEYSVSDTPHIMKILEMAETLIEDRTQIDADRDKAGKITRDICSSQKDRLL